MRPSVIFAERVRVLSSSRRDLGAGCVLGKITSVGNFFAFNELWSTGTISLPIIQLVSTELAASGRWSRISKVSARG